MILEVLEFGEVWEVRPLGSLSWTTSARLWLKSGYQLTALAKGAPHITGQHSTWHTDLPAPGRKQLDPTAGLFLFIISVLATLTGI